MNTPNCKELDQATALKQQYHRTYLLSTYVEWVTRVTSTTLSTDLSDNQGLEQHWGTWMSLERDRIDVEERVGDYLG